MDALTGPQFVVALGLLVIVLLLIVADRHVSAAASKFAWLESSMTLATGKERVLSLRTQRGYGTVLALDKLDVSPIASFTRLSCCYCLGLVPHSDACCAAAADLEPVPKMHPVRRAWWIGAGPRLRALLVAATTLERAA